MQFRISFFFPILIRRKIDFGANWRAAGVTHCVMCQSVKCRQLNVFPVKIPQWHLARLGRGLHSPLTTSSAIRPSNVISSNTCHVESSFIIKITFDARISFSFSSSHSVISSPIQCSSGVHHLYITLFWRRHDTIRLSLFVAIRDATLSLYSRHVSSDLR